jgi:hypothetical protein
LKRFWRIPVTYALALLGVLCICGDRALAQRQANVEKPALTVVEVKEPGGQILSYRHLAGSSDVRMRGTRLAPEARISLKIGSRPGFVEIDINRGGISGLKPAHRLGRDFLTYVLWAVSVDGRASNLGEITFEGDRPLSVNVTTPYQTFWLMVTAEPNYAVVDPSPRVVLYSVGDHVENDKRAISLRGDLFFFTHYTTYDSAAPEKLEPVPNQLLQARKAVELASRSTILAGDRAPGSRLKEEQYTREALKQAKAFLARAEDAYQKDPNSDHVVQFARTAAQSAENARSLAMGAVGGLLVRQLEGELASTRHELARLQAERSKPRPAPEPVTLKAEAEVPANTLVELATRPTVWFALIGWGAALVLLFRRRSI